jgi:hypothetical protein
MSTTDPPKRRLVTYVAEETYDRLNIMARDENRSISSIAETLINIGLNKVPAQSGTDQHTENSEELKSSVLEVISNLPDDNLQSLAEKLSRILEKSMPAQTGTVQHVENSEEMKSSVLEVISNLPDDNLQSLAEKLSRILEKSMPAQTGTVQHTSNQNTNIPIIFSRFKKPNADKSKVLEIAVKLQTFMNKNNISQRTFKETFGVDVTHLSRWIQGTKGMSEEKIQKLELILSNPI